MLFVHLFCLFYTRNCVSFFSSTWYHTFAKACDCGTPWTSHLTA